MGKDHHKDKHHKHYGKFCCCPAKIGVNFVGLISLGLLIYYFVLFIASA